MKSSSPNKLNAQIYDEASEWFVEFRTGDVPHEQILLRWTAAFKEKANKLAQYQAAGIVNAFNRLAGREAFLGEKGGTGGAQVDIKRLFHAGDALGT